MSNHLKKVAKEIATLEQIYQKTNKKNDSNSKNIMMAIEHKMTQLFEENVRSFEDMDKLDAYIQDILAKENN